MNSIKKFAGSLSEELIQYGNSNHEPDVLNLRAGDLSMLFTNGSLRYISAGKNELIRMVYPAVRDRNWVTIKPYIEDKKSEITENSFRITLKCLYNNGEMVLSANYVIEGKQDNSIILTMEGEALTQFEKNRIGFCVLHPVESCAGNNCVIEHIDGTMEQSIFPEEISPHQVFRNIRSMKWLANGICCIIGFEGDVFETEDQRNWSDASYKTYSTPLSIPYPVTLEKGISIYQRVLIRTEGISHVKENPDDTTVVRLFPEETFRLPSVGICQSSRLSPLNKSEIKVLRAVRFNHYRADLYLFESDWQEKAELAYNESSDLGYPLKFALFFDDNAARQVKSFINWFTEKRPSVSSILLYHKSHPSTPDPLATEVIPLLRDTIPDIKIATGTNANFAQLNRNRPGESGNDNICYSIQPQEHASDNMTLVENLAVQAYTVRSAQEFAGEKGIIVSPVTLQRRFNASTSLFELPWTGIELPPQVDNRIMSLFGACWTVGSLKYLCEAGADSITYYETAGERGIIQGEMDSKWPSYFPSVKGMLFPVYYVFRFVLGNKPLSAIKTVSSQPLKVECLALTDGKQVRVVLVNFTPSVQSVKLDCCSGLFRIRTLSTGSYGETASNCRWTGIEQEKIIKSQTTFMLEPYSINFIEGWLKH